MKKLFLILLLSTAVFASDFAVEALSAEAIEDDFDIDNVEEAMLNNDEEDDISAIEELFSAEYVVVAEETIAVKETQITEEPAEEVIVQFTENIFVDELSFETVITEQMLKDGLPRIMFTLDENALITCQFINTNEEKTIQILCLEGNQVFEVQTKSEQKFISIRGDKLKKGIYIFRVLSSETKTPLFSKAFVIG
ncbi:MAG: hypothetical protein FWE23_06800 [Chitinivibrionia bacterium]|nr:hypothetical protein [Chitinivibrionia bacterium]